MPAAVRVSGVSSIGQVLMVRGGAGEFAKYKTYQFIVSLFNIQIVDMKISFIAPLILICVSILVLPVMAQEPDEEAILKDVQNLSLKVPPTGTALYGTKESMWEYQFWLDGCANQMTKYSDGLMMIFGLPAFNWYSGSAGTYPGGAVQPVSATNDQALAQPTPPPLIKPWPGLTTIATITGESGNQATDVMIPCGYWELWYTADPLITGAQNSHSATGSNSAVFPALKMNIIDKNSGENIETVEPPGGLDWTLWQRAGDPRPWSKKIYRGNREVTFDITARHVKSYAIEVRARTEDYPAQPVRTGVP